MLVHTFSSTPQWRCMDGEKGGRNSGPGLSGDWVTTKALGVSVKKMLSFITFMWTQCSFDSSMKPNELWIGSSLSYYQGEDITMATTSHYPAKWVTSYIPELRKEGELNKSRSVLPINASIERASSLILERRWVEKSVACDCRLVESFIPTP